MEHQMKKVKSNEISIKKDDGDEARDAFKILMQVSKDLFKAKELKISIIKQTSAPIAKQV